MKTVAFKEFNDIQLLAGLMYGEARLKENSFIDELEEWIAIGQVVVNRVQLDGYPNSISGVILAPKQFSCYNENDPNNPKIWSFLKNQVPVVYYERMTVCAYLVINGLTVDLVGGATNYTSKTFYNEHKDTNHWVAEMKVTFRAGGHVFGIT